MYATNCKEHKNGRENVFEKTRKNHGICCTLQSRADYYQVCNDLT
jgi:hypothetical protein